MMAEYASKAEDLLGKFEKQILSVKKAIKNDPLKRNQILTLFISNFYEAIKEAVIRHGTVIPHYFFISESPNFGTPPVTDEIINQAKKMESDAIVCVEGFHLDTDISDIVYHVNMSAPSIGVLGWVFRVKIHDRKVEIVREMPYLFDSPDKVKSLGQLVTEMG